MRQVPIPFCLNIYWFRMLALKALRMAKGGCAAHASYARYRLARRPRAAAHRRRHATCHLELTACPPDILRESKGKGEAKPTKGE